MQVVSVCNRIPDRSREPYYRFDMFVKSLQRFEFAPIFLGLNEEWRGLMTKPRRLRTWLRDGQCSADVLIVSDAFDIVFDVHPIEVAEAYVRQWPDAPIVFNAEKGIFPRGELVYAFANVPGPWKFLNSGFMVGKPSTILELLEAMWLDDIADDHQARGSLDGGAGRWINPNDQGHFQYAYAAKPVPIFLDHTAILCQCLSACTVDEFDLSSERIRNTVTDTYPLVFHFNGGSKNDLMPIFLRKWGLE